MNPFCIPFAINNMGGALLAMDLNFMGPNYSISTACATGNFCILRYLLPPLQRQSSGALTHRHHLHRMHAEASAPPMQDPHAYWLGTLCLPHCQIYALQES